jgi:DNA-binding MarR family transcriptional regulator
MSKRATPRAAAPSQTRAAPPSRIAVIERELVFLARWLEAAQRRQSYPMERASYLLLLRLGDGPQRVAHLATSLGLDGSTVTRQLAALDAAGWIKRSTHPRDARATLVEATPAGLEAMDDLRQFRVRRIGTLLADWSATEQAELGRALAHLNEVLERNALS